MSHTQIHSKSGAKRQTGIPNVLARLVSDFSNPLLVPPFVFLSTAAALSLSATEMGWITLISLLFFTLIPFGITLYLLQIGQIQSLDVPDRANRNKLFRYIVLSSTAGSLILAFLCMGKQPILVITALVFLMNPVLGYLINRTFKISIHTAALATAGTLLLLLYLQVPEMNLWIGILSLGILLILLPIMVWARFQLGIHSPAELTGGFLAGIVLTLLEIGIMHNVLVI